MPPSRPVVVNFSQIADAFGGAEAAFAAHEEADAPPTQDETAFRAVMSRAITALQDSETEPGVLSSPDDAAGALLQSFIAEQAEAGGLVQPTTGDALEAKFDKHDYWGWARGAGWNFLSTKLGRQNRHALLPWPKPGDTQHLPRDAKVAILGDWGTGLYGAPRIADAIEQHGDDYAALVHLGDVYYSGTETEVAHRLIQAWPKVDAPSRFCNSNHEMYSGGGPYFTETLSTYEQTSSAFVLETDDWLLVGLDTAYDEYRLADGQLEWLKALLQTQGDRGLVLLSHHMLYPRYPSKHESPADLQRQLADVLDARRVTAWYWGHEHLCSVFDPHPNWGLYGRCVGHSGYPYIRPKFGDAPLEKLAHDASWRKVAPRAEAPSSLVLDGPNHDIGEHADKYGPNGFMTLELHPGRLREAVCDAEGRELWSNEIDVARP
ncbi:MAG TPA: metallophosphoesterase [Acidimicrobiales bacterium]|nr:metallophosphoesterase [Acidimicrobiales bacterium]